jgi:hypothetical protein
MPKKKTAADFAKGGPKGGWYFGLHLNEYAYRRVRFTKHKTRDLAEKKHSPYFKNEESPVSQDFSTYVFQGVQELESWAKECNYSIDWDEMLLTYHEPD